MKSGNMRIGGADIFFEHIPCAPAPPGSPTLVFLHEGLGSSAGWGDFSHRLCDTCQLPGILYDRAGYGRSSPKPLPWQADFLDAEAKEYLPEILKKQKVKQPVLVGHSDGATIALLYGAAFPKKPAGLVLMAPHVFVEPLTREGIRRANAIFAMDLREKLSRLHGEKTGMLFTGWRDVWLSEEFQSWDITGVLPDIRCPVLVIQGNKDEYGTLGQVAAIRDRLADRCRTLILPGVRHIPHRQAADAVIAAIASFVAELDTGTASMVKQP